MIIFTAHGSPCLDVVIKQSTKTLDQRTRACTPLNDFVHMREVQPFCELIRINRKFGTMDKLKKYNKDPVTVMKDASLYRFDYICHKLYDLGEREEYIGEYDKWLAKNKEEKKW